MQKAEKRNVAFQLRVPERVNSWEPSTVSTSSSWGNKVLPYRGPGWPRELKLMNL